MHNDIDRIVVIEYDMQKLLAELLESSQPSLDDVTEVVKVKMAYERDTEGLRRFAQLKLRFDGRRTLRRGRRSGPPAIRVGGERTTTSCRRFWRGCSRASRRVLPRRSAARTGSKLLLVGGIHRF